jgi:Uma2 family endonuclease
MVGAPLAQCCRSLTVVVVVHTTAARDERRALAPRSSVSEREGSSAVRLEEARALRPAPELVLEVLEPLA